MPKIIIKAVAGIVISALVLFAYLNEHEKAHKQIYIYSGCNNVSIHWTWQGAYTYCDMRGYKESEQTIFLHSLNEIIGYNVQALIMIILIFLIWQIIRI